MKRSTATSIYEQLTLIVLIEKARRQYVVNIIAIIWANHTKWVESNGKVVDFIIHSTPTPHTIHVDEVPMMFLIDIKFPLGIPRKLLALCFALYFYVVY